MGNSTMRSLYNLAVRAALACTTATPSRSPSLYVFADRVLCTSKLAAVRSALASRQVVLVNVTISPSTSSTATNHQCGPYTRRHAIAAPMPFRPCAHHFPHEPFAREYYGIFESGLRHFIQSRMTNQKGLGQCSEIILGLAEVGAGAL